MRPSRFTPLRIALFLGLGLSAMRFHGCLYLELADVRTVDYRLIQRGPEQPTSDVVIVAIDEASLQRVGRWPWSRATMARLLDQLTAAGPAVIGFDIVQAEATEATSLEGLLERVDPPTRAAVRRALDAEQSEDDLLADSVRASERAVLGYFFDFEAAPSSEAPSRRLGTYNVVDDKSGGRGARRVREAPRMVGNLPALTDAARDLGYFNFFPEPHDGAIRHIPTVIRYRDELALPLSLAMLRVYRPRAMAAISFAKYGVESVRLGPVDIPVAEDGQLLLNYRGPGRTFRHVPAIYVMDGRVPAEILRDKLVLVGVTAAGIGDLRSAPFDEAFPGVEIHATAIDNILRGDFLWQPKFLVLIEIVVILGLVLVLGTALRVAKGLTGVLVALVLLVIYLAGSQTLFESRGMPLSLVYPILSISLTYVAISVQHYVAEERERRKTRKALELYLSPSTARLVSEQPGRLKLGGEKRDMTVLFSDVREFTAISERLQPEELVDLLNEHLGEMTDEIFLHDGMLDKYIGDAVMAVWGAPLPQADHAARACAAALGMLARLRHDNEEWRRRGWPGLQMGIGLSTGPMIFGNMGSARHLSLTVMGDNVNLGSRLEGLTKYFGSGIIASEATVRAAGDAVVARELDLVRVKGKAHPVRIYEILGPAGERHRWDPLLEQFATGLAAYRETRWQEAIDVFHAIQRRWPEDGPARRYLERCDAMRTAPPTAGWDTVTIMEDK